MRSKWLVDTVRFHEKDVVEEDLSQVNISNYHDHEMSQTHGNISILLDIVVRMSLDNLLHCRLGVGLLSESHG